jgi:hypothetical protein
MIRRPEGYLPVSSWQPSPRPKVTAEREGSMACGRVPPKDDHFERETMTADRRREELLISGRLDDLVALA